MKELSLERRALLAAVLSLAVIYGWGLLFKPPQPPKPPQAHVQQPATQPAEKPPASATPAAAQAAPAAPPQAKGATQEKTIVVENGLYRVELSNRGGVVRSWQLKKYKDDAKPPRTLDLVHRETAQQTGGWPFSIALEDPELEKQANTALFEVAPGAATLEVPAEIVFEWSDAHLAISKRLKFDRSYVVQLETSVTLDGRPLAHGVAWLGGFGDTTVYMPAETVQVLASAGGKLESLPYKKLGTPDQPAQRLRQIGSFDYVGIEDRYFAAVFLPRSEPSAPRLTLTHWKLERDVVVDGKSQKEPVAQMAAGSAAPGPLALRVYVGPKDLDELKKIAPPLTDLIQFGWLEFIAMPLFRLLEWIHRYVPNYGWAIILMTVVINMILFPLKVKSWRSMQKMQKVAPEMKAIQERYKKYSMRDPRKQQMNQEVMALYKREGINPMGGCLPTLLQMPIWFGLYRMLGVTIELRHAGWLGWIRDLSAKDPYYILPVAAALTMYLMQKTTPVTTTDPTQQKMMQFMPLFLGVIFFNVSSGLVIYVLSSNLVGMAQQWYLNRTASAQAQAPRGKNGKKKK